MPLRDRDERESEAKMAAEAYANQYAPQRPMSDEEIVAEFFKYQPPTPITSPKFQAINQAAKNFAEVILANCPRGADRSGAINLIRSARMVANAAIALNGLSLY
jgi:hypothetical protein